MVDFGTSSSHYSFTFFLFLPNCKVIAAVAAVEGERLLKTTGRKSSDRRHNQAKLIATLGLSHQSVLVDHLKVEVGRGFALHPGVISLVDRFNTLEGLKLTIATELDRLYASRKVAVAKVLEFCQHSEFSPAHVNAVLQCRRCKNKDTTIICPFCELEIGVLADYERALFGMEPLEEDQRVRVGETRVFTELSTEMELLLMNLSAGIKPFPQADAKDLARWKKQASAQVNFAPFLMPLLMVIG